MKKKKTETWTYPTTEQTLIDFWNEMIKRADQLNSWKRPPSAERRQKELIKIIKKYSKKIGWTSGKKQTIKIEVDLKNRRKTA